MKLFTRVIYGVIGSYAVVHSYLYVARIPHRSFPFMFKIMCVLHIVNLVPFGIEFYEFL